MFRSTSKDDPREQLTGQCSLCGVSCTVMRGECVVRPNQFGEPTAAVRCRLHLGQNRVCSGIVYVYSPAPVARADYPEVDGERQ